MSGVTNYQCPVCGVVVSSGHVCAMSAIQARIDTLTAERDAARAEFAEWLDASRKALDTHVEVVAERDAAREERDDIIAICRGTQMDDAAIASMRAYVSKKLLLEADRDRLAACVERVRKVTRVKIGVGPYPDRDYTEVVHVSDILAALEDA